MSQNHPPLSHINDDLGAVFVNGYTGPRTLSADARAAARAAFSPRDAELALSLLAAEIMALKMDAQFFAGPLPENSSETLFSLELLPADPGKSFNFWEGTALLCGRSPFHGELIRAWGRFFSALPLTGWLTVNSDLQQNAVTFCRIEAGRNGAQAPAVCRSLSGFSAEAELKILICISPPEPVLS